MSSNVWHCQVYVTCSMSVIFRYFIFSCLLASTLLIALIFFHRTNWSRNWSSSVVDFRIIVITYSRSSSFRRLLESINKAYYYGNNVVLEIWIDRFENGTVDLETERVANDFRFDHGTVKVNIQPSHVGIQGQWITVGILNSFCTKDKSMDFCGRHMSR